MKLVCYWRVASLNPSARFGGETREDDANLAGKNNEVVMSKMCEDKSLMYHLIHTHGYIYLII